MHLFSLADLILLVIQESTFWKRETKHSPWLHLSLQLLQAPSQDTLSLKSLCVKVVKWFKLESVCVRAPSFCFSWGHHGVWVTTQVIIATGLQEKILKPSPCLSRPTHQPCKSHSSPLWLLPPTPLQLPEFTMSSHHAVSFMSSFFTPAEKGSSKPVSYANGRSRQSLLTEASSSCSNPRPKTESYLEQASLSLLSNTKLHNSQVMKAGLATQWMNKCLVLLALPAVYQKHW